MPLNTPSANSKQLDLLGNEEGKSEEDPDFNKKSVINDSQTSLETVPAKEKGGRFADRESQDWSKINAITSESEVKQQKVDEERSMLV